MLRAHQARVDAIIRDKIEKPNDNEVLTDILAYVTPGGGKSMLPLICGKLIMAGLADAICWVVPRLNLQYQAESNFIDMRFRKMLRHDLTIRASTNDQNPCRGLNGFATTYQALTWDNRHAVEDFERRRYILILDEFHHVGLDTKWRGFVEALYNLAVFRLLMTGTLERGDGGLIDFMPYRNLSTDMVIPDLTDKPSMRVVRYSRTDALMERAILPIRAYLHKGAARWRDAEGRVHHYNDFSKAKGKEANAAIYTAIRTEFADELLRRGIRHWIEHRKRNKSSRCLVVAANIQLAKLALDFLRNECHITARVATSEDNAEAKESIRQFSEGKVPVLVGVAMFYEGFDCPAASHLICLTNYRSTPWIEQMIARAVRVDSSIPYTGQYAHIFAPDDELMRQIITRMENEQDPVVMANSDDKKPKQQRLFDFGDSNGYESGPVEPLSSDCSGHREYTLAAPLPEPESFLLPHITPSDNERQLRKDIETHVRIFSSQVGRSPYHLNRRLKEVFGKARDHMTSQELTKVKEYLAINFRINPNSRPPRRTSSRRLEA